MLLDYFIYDLASGEILQRLSCSAGADRKANVALQPGRGAALAEGVEGLPDTTMKIDLQTKRLVPKGGYVNCLAIAALSLRIASIDEDHQRAEPGMSVETECGIEAGVSRRDGHLVGDVGLKLRPFGDHGPWLRGGAEFDRTRETMIYGQIVRGRFVQPVYSVTPLDPEWHVRPRVSVGIDVPVLPHLSIAGEAEATRGGKILFSLVRKF